MDIARSTSRSHILSSPLSIMALIAVVAGVAVSVGGLARILTLVLAAAFFLTSIVPLVVKEHIKNGYMVIEVPVTILLLSTLVFRQRDAETLAQDPLDAAAIFRVAFVGIALFLALVSLASPSEVDAEERQSLKCRPFTLFALYIAVVFIGTRFAVQPLNVVYRSFELIGGWLVLMAARHSLGRAALPRIEMTIYWYSVALMAIVWLNALIFPSEALTSTMGESPLPYQLASVMPTVSSNSVGFLGAMVGLWSLGYRLTPHREHGPRPRVAALLAGAGFLTLLAAQYRTGYAAVAAGLVVLCIVRGRQVLAALLVVGALVVTFWGDVLLEAQPYLLRGETTEDAADLSGRIYWWEQALEVWKESPIVGKGLLSATRFEVLAEIGAGDTSTIHSTWIEALVGTGIVGAVLLAASILIAWRRSIAEGLRRNGRVVPALLITLLVVRSLTASTLGIFGPEVLLLLSISLTLPDSLFSQLAGRVPSGGVPATQLAYRPDL
jgi:O-antigen ligase